MRQISMSFMKDYKKEFGGSLLVGKRKERRPLSTKHPMHLILRSELSGVFNPGNRSIENLIRKYSEKFQVKIYDMALNWSHIHLVIRVKDRQGYLRFIRALASAISLKARAKYPTTNKIFNLRPFTRILSWGRDFKNVLAYQTLNQLESLGFILRKNNQERPPF